MNSRPALLPLRVLLDSKAEYRLTFDEAPVGIAHTDLAGRWLRVNGRLRAMLGYSPAALETLDIHALTHQDNLASDAEGRRRLLAGDIAAYAGEQRYLRADGRYFWAHSKVSLHRGSSGEPKYFIVVVEDISERKQAQQELSHIFDLSPDMICTSTYAGRFTRTNAAWTRALGYTADELRGESFLSFVHPDDRAATVAELSRLTEGRTVFGFTNRYRTAGGSYRWIEWHAQADPAAQLIYAVARDQTERRRLEQELRHAQKMEAVGQLAGGVAHDFNNLLTAILGFSEMALDQLAPGDPVRQDVQEIVHAGQSAASLTRQLLALSRKQILEPHVLDVSTLVDGMQGLLRRIISEDVELVTTLCDTACRINADPGLIEQVIMNLAVNARDAMPSGGTLRIAVEQIDVDAAFVAAHTGAAAGPHVRLTLSDTGSGMGPDVLAHLFEPFFTTKPPGKGTGLGLATVYGIVHQSGGYVWVESAPGHGTSFMINFPLVSAEADPAPGTAVAVAGPAGETILLVEDQREVRDTLRQALTRHGYVVIEAADGPAALARLQGWRGPVHLLLTDVVMPYMSGQTLAGEVARHDPGVRVLYTSGYTDEAIVRHGVLDPRIDFIQKPFRPEQLLARVRDVLDRPLSLREA